jgi:hypothetical protein
MKPKNFHFFKVEPFTAKTPPAKRRGEQRVPTEAHLAAVDRILRQWRGTPKNFAGQFV